MKKIPMEVIESCMIDGAKEFRIFFQIILPLAKSGLATRSKISLRLPSIGQNQQPEAMTWSLNTAKKNAENGAPGKSCPLMAMGKKSQL
jgi:hypothetical protein